MGPLQGLRIAELYSPAAWVGVRLAGALAGRMLADFGALVSVVQPPPGDVLRRLPPFTAAGGSAAFAFLSAGKQVIEPGAEWEGQDGLIIDAGGFDALRGPQRTAATAVLSMAPDTMHGSEFTALALSGVLDLVGDPEREPLRLGGHQAAYSCGLSAFTGLLAALCVRDAAPRTVRVNLLDTLLWINWKSVIGAQGGGGASRQGPAAEWQVVGCADGWLALVYQEADWGALTALVGDPALQEARFATAAARRANGREVAERLAAGLGHYTREEIRALALAQRLPLGPVWSLTELLEDRHYLERGVFFPARLPDGTPGMLASLPVVWNGARLAPGPIPADGEVADA
jgi:crotonobetainyl-CoA:carnitine CoA-transferase CaiB-like acyl-CoA transferase